MESIGTVEAVRWTATGCGIVAAIVVSLKLGVRATGWGFVIFTVSSVAWVVSGIADDMPSLIAQNVVLTVINVIGIYRWLIAKEPASGG